MSLVEVSPFGVLALLVATELSVVLVVLGRAGGGGGDGGVEDFEEGAGASKEEVNAEDAVCDVGTEEPVDL